MAGMMAARRGTERAFWGRGRVIGYVLLVIRGGLIVILPRGIGMIFPGEMAPLAWRVLGKGRPRICFPS